VEKDKKYKKNIRQAGILMSRQSCNHSNAVHTITQLLKNTNFNVLLTLTCAV